MTGSRYHCWLKASQRFELTSPHLALLSSLPTQGRSRIKSTINTLLKDRVNQDGPKTPMKLLKKSGVTGTDSAQHCVQVWIHPVLGSGRPLGLRQQEAIFSLAM